MGTVFRVATKDKRPKSHLPVAILIDKSLSTGNIRGIMETCARELLQRLKAELTFKGIVEVLIVFFSDTYQEADFTPLDNIDPAKFVVPESEGTTNTGKALLYALGQFKERKIVWQQAGEDYFQPLMFLLTDGKPTAGELQNPKYAEAHAKAEKEVKEAYAEAAREIRAWEDGRKLIFIAAGVQRRDGESADMDSLHELSEHDDHIFSVTDGEGLDGVQRFFNEIYTMTQLVYKRTPLSELLKDALDNPLG
ncbi:MAG: VWA domain-containing protein [Oscillospiraceae bacterium]|nr:VWA domain-containing protein [Oscillospiraceae bacterium]